MLQIAHLAAATLCLIAVAIGGSEAEAKTERSLRLGNSWEFQFEGNPSTGYTWQLDVPASSGLDLIRLQSLGYVSGKTRKRGAPAPFKFRVTCVKPGHADLWFQYVGPTGKLSRKYGKHEVWVRCH